MAEDPLLKYDCSEDEDENEQEQAAEVKQETPVLYQRRWIMLSLLTLQMVNSLMQYIFYSAAARTVQRYFGVPMYAVEYLTISTMITTVVGIAPSVWLVQKTSLRTGCLINACLTTIAAFIKFFAASSRHSTGYTATLIGQIISSIATCFIISMPAELAAVWFSVDQRSLATCIVTSGHFLGIGISFILATSFVAGDTNPNTIEWGLKSGLIINVTLSLLVLIAVYILFQNKPPTPPSKSQAMLDVCHLRPTYMESLSMLVHNRHYSLFLVGNGTIFGSLYAFWQVIQEALPDIFHNKEYEIGMLGVVCMISAIPGIILSGIWLDRTKSYKFSIELASFLAVLSCVIFTLLLKFTTSIAAMYVVGAIYAFFVTSIGSMGFVLASEMTYPVPETISSGSLYVSSQIFGAVLTMTGSFIYVKVHDSVISSTFLNIAVILASVFVFVGKAEFKRYGEDKSNNNSQ